MKIELISDAGRQAWDHYVEAHPMGTAYHFWAWKQAVEKAYGFKGYYFTAVENQKIIGVLPLFYVKPPLMSGQFVSLPYCDAGGVLADSPAVAEKLIRSAFEKGVSFSLRSISIRSIGPIAGTDPERSKNESKVRMVLDLPADSDALMASLKSKVRSQAKKPSRDGLTAESGRTELLDTFYPLFAENMRDLGSPVHSKDWFKAILEFYKDRCRLFIVRMPDLTPAAGGILLFHSSMVSVPWASSLRRYNRWNPNMLLYRAFLSYSADHGFPVFDFGRSTPTEGTFRFKKQWGACPKPLYWAEVGCQDDRIILTGARAPQNGTHPARRLAESMIRKMPVPAATLLGTMTRKYITL